MSGKSAEIYSLEVGRAIAKGGDQDANGIPQPGGVSFLPLPMVSGNIGALEGPQNFDDEDQGRSTPGQNRRLPVGVVNTTGAPLYGAEDGEVIPAQYPDSVTVNARFCSFGGADPEGFGAGLALASGLGLLKPAVATVASVADGAADGSMFRVSEADAAHLAVGLPVSFQNATEIQSRYRQITDIGAPAGGEVEVTIHPKMPRQVLTGETVRLCFAFFPVVGNVNAGNDVHLRISAGGSGAQATYGRLASLCRLAGFSLSGENGRIALGLTLAPAVVLPVSNPVTVSVPEASGTVLTQRYGSFVEVADAHQGAVAPFSQSAVEVSQFDWSVDVQVSANPSSPDSRSVMRMQDMEIDNCTASVTLGTEQNSDLADMLRKSELRTVICTMGPHSPGHGAAFMLLNAGRADGDSTVGQEGPRINQSTTLIAVEDFAGCAGAGSLPRAPWVFAIPKA